jgi:arylamine N-acetyltransferase
MEEEYSYENNYSDLTNIRNTIENMSKFNQIETLRILQSDKKITLNENKNGVHINLSDVQKETVDRLKNYINYVIKQEISLIEIEKQKDNFKNTYFNKK